MKFTWSEIGEGLRIAYQAMRANKMRTILTTLGILIGIIVVTVIISVIQGLNAYVSGEISGLGADTVYISRMPWIIQNYEEFLKYQKRHRITADQYDELRKHVTLAEAVAPELMSGRMMKYKSNSIDRVFITGTTESYTVTSNVQPDVGRFFSDQEVHLRRAVCLIGVEVAENLFEDEDPIGKRLKIGSYPFTVIGILEERGQMFGFSMDNMAIIPYSVFQKYFGSRRSVDMQVKAKDPQAVDALIDELTGIMRRIRGIEAGRPDDFSINQQSQLMDLYRNMTQVLWIVLIGIGSIALLVGGIGIMNIMLVSVSERTWEIGIRKAVGAKRRIIMWQFLVESILISGIGVTIGIAISVAIALLIRSASPIPVNISASVAFLGIGFTVTIGLFFGLYPASKAARLDPIVALRHE